MLLQQVYNNNYKNEIMKKLIYILIAIIGITLVACEPDEVTINTLDVSDAGFIPAELNTPETISFGVIQTTDIADGNENETAATFSWSEAISDKDEAITYYLQLDVADNDFATAVTIPLAQDGTSELSRMLTFGELNDALNKLSETLKALASPLAINFGEENNLNLRVESILGAAIGKGYSQPVNITVTPYFKGLSETLIISGNALSEDVALINTDGVFEGTLNLTSDTFKFFADPVTDGFSFNYEYFESNGYTIDPLLENANDDAMNFLFTGTEGLWDIILDTNAKTITLAEILVTPPDNLYLVGDATEAGWSPTNNNTPLFKDPNEEGVFTFTGYFIGGGEGFKLLEIGDWTPQWGKGANDGELAGKPATQDGDPSAIPVPESGYYSLRVDFNTLSYTFEPYDASGATEYATIGVIGDATPTGWGF